MMMTMNISLPDEMKAFIEAQVAKEGYASVSEYLRAVIRDVQKHRPSRSLKPSSWRACKARPAR